MNILFLMIAFPDVERTENLYTELAHEFKDHNHNVYVATILGDSGRTETIMRNERGVHVLRINAGKLFNVNYIVKGINTVLLPYRFNQAIKKYLTKKPGYTKKRWMTVGIRCSCLTILTQ